MITIEATSTPPARDNSWLQQGSLVRPRPARGEAVMWVRMTTTNSTDETIPGTFRGFPVVQDLSGHQVRPLYPQTESIPKGGLPRHAAVVAVAPFAVAPGSRTYRVVPPAFQGRAAIIRFPWD
jgi:hypothetical protein